LQVLSEATLRSTQSYQLVAVAVVVTMALLRLQMVVQEVAVAVSVEATEVLAQQDKVMKEDTEVVVPFTVAVVEVAQEPLEHQEIQLGTVVLAFKHL
jgi:hypothetical protein